MNPLIEGFPHTVRIGRQDVDIDTDFRTGIKFELLMQDPQIPPAEKVWIALELYYPTIPDDIEAAMAGIMWFYRCGKDEPKQVGMSGGRSAPAYSFDIDAGRIIAAFLAQYRIDLTTCAMHWWMFRELFVALEEHHLFTKVVGWREIKITGSMTREQKNFYARMKKAYALPAVATAEEMSLAARDQRMIDYVTRRYEEAGLLC